MGLTYIGETTCRFTDMLPTSRDRVQMEAWDSRVWQVCIINVYKFDGAKVGYVMPGGMNVLGSPPNCHIMFNPPRGSRTPRLPRIKL